ncbi:MAG TPA: tetratricopeptide repeat protein [Gemmataceae bacterium]|nr:tetratricopeptide repeat protein [Gemmataceae bacterium]
MFARLRRHPYWSLGLALALIVVALIGGVNLWAWQQFRTAGQALDEERLDEAARHIAICLRVWPRSVNVYRRAARIARWRRDYPQAEEHLHACRRLQPASTEEVQLEWILLRAERGEVDEVAPGLWDCVAHDHPETEQILATLSRTYMRQLRYPSALHCLNAWLERQPDSARALDWRGWVWEQLQHDKAARSDYQRALELAPGRDALRLRLARLQLTRRDAPAALHTLEPLRQSTPDDPDMLLVLARCRALEGETEEAGRLLDAVLVVRPDLPAALLARGDVALQLDRPAEAESLLRRGLKVSPSDPDLLYALSRSLQRQPGREQEAEKCLDHYHRTKNDLERVTTLLRKTGGKAPVDADVACEIGTLLLRLNQENVGLYWLNKALEIDRLHQRTREVLGAYREKKNDSPGEARNQ